MAEYGVKVSGDFARELAELSKSQQVPVEQVIQQAIATYVYLSQETASGNKVSITNSEDRVLQDVGIRQ